MRSQHVGSPERTNLENLLLPAGFAPHNRHRVVLGSLNRVFNLWPSSRLASAIENPQLRSSYWEQAKIVSPLLLRESVGVAAVEIIKLKLPKPFLERTLVQLARKCSPQGTTSMTPSQEMLTSLRRDIARSMATLSRGWNFASIKAAEKAIDSFCSSPYEAIMEQYVSVSLLGDERKSSRAIKGRPIAYQNDRIIGPRVREAFSQIVDLLVRATMITDAVEHLKISVNDEAFHELVTSLDKGWAFFTSRTWRNMVALSEHLRTTMPKLSKEELGSAVMFFKDSRYPIEDLEHYRAKLHQKMQAKRAAALSSSTVVPNTRTPPNIVASNDMKEQLAATLSEHNKHDIAPPILTRYCKTLSNLARKSGMTDVEEIRDLIKQGYHPEMIIQELRQQLRPVKAESSAGTITKEPSSERVECREAPSSFLNFYRDEAGNDVINAWLDTQPRDVRELVEDKLDLIRQGATGKHLSRPTKVEHSGLHEWRIFRAKAVLRIYFLPRHRDTGEVSILLIGDKNNQHSDLKEATRRAAIVTARRQKGE